MTLSYPGFLKCKVTQGGGCTNISANVLSLSTGNEHQKPSEEVNIRCNLCQSHKVGCIFSKRKEFLKHLNLVHYRNELLEAFPFSEGSNRNLCLKTIEKPSRTEIYLCWSSLFEDIRVLAESCSSAIYEVAALKGNFGQK